jgi:mannose-6-phosphate isomerase-like protein (cupin superfamily)
MEPDPIAAPLAGAGPLGFADGAFVIVEWQAADDRIGPTQPVAPLHVHHGGDEAWYVLEGTLGFRLGSAR